MSAYEKSPQVDLLDFDTTRTFHDTSSFSSFTQPPSVTHLLPSTLESQSIPDDDSIQFVVDNDYAGTHPFDLSRSPVLGLDFHNLPEVTSYSPTNGSEGSKLSVYFQSAYDVLLPPNPASFALLFGSERCDCIVTPLGFDKSHFQYALSIDTPSFAATGCHSCDVPMQMIMDDNDEQGPKLVEVGVFTYEQSAQSPANETKKRRMSSSSDDTPGSTKTAPLKQLRIKENPGTFSYSESLAASPYSSYLPTPNTANVYPTQYQQVASPRPSIGQYSGPAASQPMVKAPSPLASSWSPSFSSVNLAAHSPGLSMTPISQASTMASPVKPANPTLIRTSTIQQSLSGPTASQVQTFNPYAMYPSKAVLKLNGDLDSMVEKWTPEECDIQRRLVQFTRRQNGSTIHADFKPVAPGDRVPNSICISCIWWAGKKECFVTSVDTIYLLESLVGVRFTVEEKNRIRRNLEGFRPLTVSKAKADSEDFFKVIMGFPNPKPRNIEKDVKVFPWKILSHALKKIIGKYSASYSSTAGALPTPVAASYPSSSASEAEHHSGSPRSVSESVSSSTYVGSVAGNGLSPHLQPPKPRLGSPSTGSGDLHFMVPSARQFTGVPTPYAYPVVSQQQAHRAAAGRNAWEYAAFDCSSGAEASQAISLGYPRGGSIATTNNDFNPSLAAYSMGHTTSES